MQTEDIYAPVLRGLSGSGISYHLIGTYALKLYFPQLLASYHLKDADIVLEPSMSNLRSFIRHMKAGGWTVKIWEKEVDTQISESELKGKFYLRCTRNEYMVDATYEPALPFAEFSSDGILCKGIQVGCLEAVMQLKSLKGQPEDLDTLSRIRAFMKYCF